MTPDFGPVGRLVRGEVAWPRVLLGVLVVALVVAVFALSVTSTAAFGLYNPAWDGASDFRDHVDDDPTANLTIVQETAEYEPLEAEETVAFVTAPDTPYTGADADRLEAFVAGGGTLVVLENFDDPGNALLADVGAESRVDGQLLRDERHYFHGPAMPIATVITVDDLEGDGNEEVGAEDEPPTDIDGQDEALFPPDVERLTLNYATAVVPGEEATVLVETSPYAYLGPADVELDDVELESHPVVATESVGAGTVVVVGDPSITINTMFDEPDNAAFLAALYADRSTVVVDVSHAEALPPLVAATLLLRDSTALQLLVGLGAIAVVGLLATGRIGVRGRPGGGGSIDRPTDRAIDAPSDRSSDRVVDRIGRRFIGRITGRHSSSGAESDRPMIDDTDRAAYLRERYPDWDDERRERVMTALNPTGRKRRNDE